MVTGLRTSLSPDEEVALRRIACGSSRLDAATTQRLTLLSLVEHCREGFRLTPLGQRHLAALVKAPLLTPRPSVTALLDATLAKYADHPPH